jgi:hypothetical protein
MEIELHPAVSLLPETFNVLVAPVEMLVEALNSHINLQQNHHTFLIVDHDPMLYEDAGEMVEYVTQALKQTSREATILLYAPALDPHLQKITELADRVFCFYEMPGAQAKGRAKADPKMPVAQKTLEAYS